MRPLSALTLCACMVIACAGEPPPISASASAGPGGTDAPAVPPVIAFEPSQATAQAPRYVAGRWTSSLPLRGVRFAIDPDPGPKLADEMHEIAPPAPRSPTPGARC